MGKKTKKATKKFQRKELGKEIQKRRAHKIIKGQREKATKGRKPEEGKSRSQREVHSAIEKWGLFSIEAPRGNGCPPALLLCNVVRRWGLKKR